VIAMLTTDLWGLKPNGRIELPRRIKPGSELVGTWNRQTYRIVVLKDGFAYDGRTYTSLSEIASEISRQGERGHSGERLRRPVSRGSGEPFSARQLGLV
jgi:hypothetical protein